MGMYCSMTSISNKTIGNILLYPPLLWKVVAPDDEEFYAEAVADYEPSLKVLFLQLLGAKAEKLVSYKPTRNEGTYFDIDKAWHGIHYMLTGSATMGPSLYNFLLAGGHWIKGTDDSYRVFKPGEVKQVSNALMDISKEEFENRFDPAKMAEKDIYPNIWNQSQEKETLEYLRDNFLGLKEYLKGLADTKMGMVIGIC